jgi:uncharacterized protein involved in cysteine biosynthesis
MTKKAPGSGIVAFILFLLLAALILGMAYLDYTIYKAKYPNTEFWMWLLD